MRIGSFFGLMFAANLGACALHGSGAVDASSDMAMVGDVTTDTTADSGLSPDVGMDTGSRADTSDVQVNPGADAGSDVSAVDAPTDTGSLDAGLGICVFDDPASTFDNCGFAP